MGWIKCSYDASYNEGDRASGIGWIYRNTNKQFLKAGIGEFHGRSTPKEAECKVYGSYKQHEQMDTGKFSLKRTTRTSTTC
ncbi:unnamed protein product [Arabidopsis lyrata]|uniref:RNase H type-1 domain-containing protein n=1 Tax=Arabidopsis lyrata subsp. lyrata TaxID=81972 RepID=D7M6L3_ARALL|nr:hypothetical protein ARALYDRAFT_909429 [Arabidopsis lyrata subsp. lyrata]CAH8271094.1 unnamed protein product [Arabidopsis lyrata]